MVRLPYGNANFGDLRARNFYYVDKTQHIPRLEDLSKGRQFGLLLRPRRFGKSTLLSMLEHYYDVGRAGEFARTFAGLAIGREPTEEHSRYLVLSLDFSGLSTDAGIAGLRQGFHRRLYAHLEAFCVRYEKMLPHLLPAFRGRLETSDPAALMDMFLALLQSAPHPLCLLVDEYDTFTNDMIARGDEAGYHDLLRPGGFVRAFYQVLKLATKSGPIGRILVTGVAPLTLNDLSTGFNILTHVSGQEDLHEVCGFTEAEVAALLEAVLASQPFTLSPAQVLDDLRRYYNGYRFSRRAHTRLYNPNMVLYFLMNLAPPDRYPERLLDTNLRTDPSRLRHLFIDRNNVPRSHPLDQIRSLLGDGYVDGGLFDTFLLDEAYSQRYFLSYLYYLGLLTQVASPAELSQVRFAIPNHATEGLYGEALADFLQKAAQVEVSRDEVLGAVDIMAGVGDLRPFLGLLLGKVMRQLSNRDMIQFDEKNIKLLMMAYMSLSEVFVAFSEMEVHQGYSDLILMPNRRYTQARYGFLIELKYIKLTEEAMGKREGGKRIRRRLRKDQVQRRVEAAQSEAEQQLVRYLSDPRLDLVKGPGGWQAWSAVFVGTDAVYCRRLGQPTEVLRPEATLA